MDDRYRGGERRADGPIEERVTRLEERFDALVRTMERQILLDTQVHADALRLITKLDDRSDSETAQRLQLAQDFRVMISNLASDVRSLATKIAIIGGALIVLANIIGPILVPIIVKRITP